MTLESLDLSLKLSKRKEEERLTAGRFVPVLPGNGGFVVMDRTWYGRVLVESVVEQVVNGLRERGFALPDLKSFG